MRTRVVGLTLILAAYLQAQVSAPTPITFGVPPGGVGAACTSGSLFYADLVTGTLASCQSSVWTAFASGTGTGVPGGSVGQLQYQVNGTTFGGFTPAGDVTFSNPAFTVVSIGGKTVTLSGNLTTTGAFNPTFAIPSSSTWTFPTGGGALILATAANTFSAAQTFNSGDFLLAGSSSGTTGIVPVAAASGTITAPSVTGTMVVAPTATTATYALFSSTTAGAPTGYRAIALTDLPPQTGTGKIVLSISPTITGHATIEGVTPTGATGTATAA